jgi:hypothetical protein
MTDEMVNLRALVEKALNADLLHEFSRLCGRSGRTLIGQQRLWWNWDPLARCIAGQLPLQFTDVSA